MLILASNAHSQSVKIRNRLHLGKALLVLFYRAAHKINISNTQLDAVELREALASLVSKPMKQVLHTLVVFSRDVQYKRPQ